MTIRGPLQICVITNACKSYSKPTSAKELIYKRVLKGMFRTAVQESENVHLNLAGGLPVVNQQNQMTCDF